MFFHRAALRLFPETADIRAIRLAKDFGGFILPELLAAVICLSGALAVCLFQVNYGSLLYILQVRTAAAGLAGELREMQRCSMFESSVNGDIVKIIVDVDGYTVFNGLKLYKSVNFADKGRKGVYFAQKIPVLRFTAAGSPSLSGIYVLRHRQLDKFSCRLSVEPVTGRVTVVEGK